MQKKPETQVSTLLPLEVREKLARAARVPITPADPLARQKAIERVTAWAKACYPRCFK